MASALRIFGLLFLAASCGGDSPASDDSELRYRAPDAAVPDAPVDAPPIDAAIVDAGAPDAAPEPGGGVTLPAVRFGPWVQAPGMDRVSIFVETKTATAITVELDGRSQTSTAGTHHELTFDGLQPSRRYWYRVLHGGQAGVVHHASTLPTPGEPVRFVVMGDHTGTLPVRNAVAAAVAAEGVDFIIGTGDLVVDSEDEPMWDAFFAFAGGLLAEVSLIPARGNHDLAARFHELFTLSPGASSAADHSFDVGAVHVVVIDSNQDPADRSAWLLADLQAARARGAERVFVSMHHGPYSCGPHGANLTVRAILASVAAKTPIDAVFSGHDHIYERGLGGALRYFVSGGGGARLYSCAPTGTTQRWVVAHHYLVVEVTGQAVRVQAKTPDGTVLDDVTF